MLGDLLDQIAIDHDGIDWWVTDSSLHMDLVPPITAVPPPSLSLTKWRTVGNCAKIIPTAEQNCQAADEMERSLANSRR